MSILAWVLILGAAAIATAVHGLVVTGGSWIVAVLLLLILIGLVQAIRTWRSDDQLMKRIERVAMDANQGILESRITLIPSGHPYAECAWAINEMMDQTETVFRDTSTVLKRMVVGEYGWAPQPGGLKGSFPELLRTVGDVEGRVQVTMESLARVMQGLGEGDLAVRMGEEVEEVFRRQVNGAMESIEQVLSQFGTIIEGMAEGDCTHRVELDGVQGDLLNLG